MIEIMSIKYNEISIKENEAIEKIEKIAREYNLEFGYTELD